MISKNKMLLVVLAGCLILAGLFYYLVGKSEDQTITATGMIEVTQTELNSKVSGYLMERNFNEGDFVQKEELLAVINQTDLSLQYLQTMSAYQSAQAKLNDLQAGSRSAEIASAKAHMIAAENNYNKAVSDYNRFNVLYQSGGISAQELDNYRVALTTNMGNLEQAQAAYQLALEGSRPDTIEAQRFAVDQAKSAMEASKALLNDTNIKSPISGRILSKNYEVGEFVNAGASIATIGDLSDCWVKVYVPSTLLGRVKLGQEAEVKIDSYPDRTFKGVVREIATEAEFTPRQTITKNERANLVFAVKVSLENTEQLFKPGMPAEVRIP